MGFLKKFFGFGKKEEENVDDKFIEEPIENKEEINEEPTQSKNFKYLDDLIHSGVKEVILDSDIVLDDGEESEYEKGIKLDVDGLVIGGNGHAIDAKGKTRIFYCTGKNITIKNITLKNGHAEDAGAIYNNGGTLTVSGSTLVGNTAERSGGAIDNIGVLTVSDSTLNGNTARNGGAISIAGNAGVKLTVSDSTLQGNTAKDYGGAISNGGGELTVSGSIFMENTAEESSGVIFNAGELTVSYSAFIGNTAERSGGAISSVVGNFKVFNCDFLNNKSLISIISNHGSYNPALLQIFNSNFMSNHAPNIIVNNGDLANVGIFNGEFKDNNIDESIIFNDGKSCTVERTIFKKHHSNIIINKSDLTLVSPKIKDEGKVILNEKYILIRKSSDGLEDKIYGEGTVDNGNIFEFKEFDFGYLDKKIHESKNKEIILEEDITFENYEIDYYEGGIELDIDNLIIDGNGHTIDAQGNTRIFYCTGKNITIKNLTLKNGYSHQNLDNPFNNDGGAIKINCNVKLTMENCKFINNTSEGAGGAIYNRMSIFTLSGSTLSGNTSHRSDYTAGAICNEYGEVTVSDSILEGNTVEFNGAGAIQNSGELTVSDSILEGNTGSWGAICNDFGEVKVSGSILTGNSYGAIQNSGELTVFESTLTGNTSKWDGGAIQNSGELTVSDSTFIENTSEKDGGAIYNNGGTLTVSGSTLVGNTAEDDGGAIYNRGGELTVSGSTLTGNTARDDGGAICLSKDSKKYVSNDCTFKDNKPDDVHEYKD